MPQERLKVVVIGAGHLGTYHLQKIMAHPSATVVGAVDTDAKARQRAAERFGIEAYSALGELLNIRGKPDCAVIATPTIFHATLGRECLEHTIDVLIEKPISAQLAEAEALWQLAKRHRCILQVGHSERFNPAIEAAMPYCQAPRYITTERLGPFSGRSTDIDVIHDLMIHDLDFVASIIPAPLREIRAIGMPVLTHAIDMAAVRLEFADGAVAQLSAGRASLEPNRKIRVFTPERYVSIDCMRNDVKVVRRIHHDDKPNPTIMAEPVEVRAGDALGAQMDHFLRAVTQRETPRVCGQAGIRALKLANAVSQQLRVPRPTSDYATLNPDGAAFSPQHLAAAPAEQRLQSRA